MGVRVWGWGGRAHASHAGDAASAAVTACTHSISVHPPKPVPACRQSCLPSRTAVWELLDRDRVLGISLQRDLLSVSPWCTCTKEQHPSGSPGGGCRLLTWRRVYKSCGINPVGLGDLQDSFSYLSVVSVAFLGRRQHCHVRETPGRTLQDFHQ